MVKLAITFSVLILLMMLLIQHRITWVKAVLAVGGGIALAGLVTSKKPKNV